MYSEFVADILERRRREVGMSRCALAERSGVSLATVNRLLSGDGLEKTSIRTIEAIAHALDLRLRFGVETLSCSMAFKERQAEAKAREIASLIQGTSALEAQAVDEETREELVRQTVHELLAGPKSRIWGAA
jgi:transcriptional regulator with XRE-family HTH domain